MPPRQSARLKSKRPAEDAPPSAPPAKVARTAETNVSLPATFSWPDTDWALPLPFDVIVLVMDLLEVNDIVMFSMSCRCTYIGLNTRAFWLAILNRILLSRPVAPHSFDLPQKSVSQIRDLCTNEVRFEREIRRRDGQASLALEFGDIEPGQVFDLVPDGDDSSDMQIQFLPGGRWAIGFLSNWEFSDDGDALIDWGILGSDLHGSPTQRTLQCWDTAQLVDETRWGRLKSRRLKPVATYLASERQQDFIVSHYANPNHVLAFQFDPMLGVVNFALGYQPFSTPAERVVEIVQLSWSSDGQPAFQLIAIYRTTTFKDDHDHSLSGPCLEGDFVLLYTLDLLVVWDWRHGTHASLANYSQLSLEPSNLRLNRFFGASSLAQPKHLPVFEFQPDSLSPTSAPPAELKLSLRYVPIPELSGLLLLPAEVSDDFDCYTAEWLPGSVEHDRHLVRYLSLEDRCDEPKHVVVSVSLPENVAKAIVVTDSITPSPFLALPDQTLLFLRGIRSEASPFSRTPRVSTPKSPHGSDGKVSDDTTKEVRLMTKVAPNAGTKMPKAGLEARFFCPMSGKLAAAFPHQDARYAFVPFVGVQ